MGAVKTNRSCKHFQIKQYHPPQQVKQEERKIFIPQSKSTEIVFVEDQGEGSSIDYHGDGNITTIGNEDIAGSAADNANNPDNNNDSHNGKEEEAKKPRGFWTSQKKLVLLQKYVEYFPPAAPWGKTTEAWQKITDSVNAVSPNDTPLGYDTCKHAVDKMTGRYTGEAPIRKAALEALALKRKHDEEKAKRRFQRELKRSRRYTNGLFVEELANGRLTEMTSAESPIDDTANQEEGSNLLPSEEDVSPTLFTESYMKQQLKYQQTVLSHLESIKNSLEELKQVLC